ncbi:nucleotide-binding protein [Phocaeicola barnesiae]|uniref:nucleotide-binding protein n=1 Tax=Phocaeicola barnesiae TaxID=376804 RepID=UPI00242C2EAD|nr:nucleotide-binding protein [Phocaeicola barnesiae]
MAKKVNESKSVASALIMNKSDFQSQLEARIRIGKDLLATSVKVINVPTPNYGYDRHKKIEYDETEKDAFFSAYRKWDAFNIDFLKRSFNIPENDYKKEYEDAFVMGIFYSNDIINDQKKTIRRKIDKLENIIERLSIIPSEKQEESNALLRNNVSVSNKIFIVHGHDSARKEATARTLTKLGLEPIILHEQADGGRTIIEKFEENSSEVGFAVILLTADDDGKAKKETNYKSRARQNVVFEMGYFVGKLGRNRVFLLLAEGVEKPGDLDGIVYTPIDDHDGWKLKLVKELKACGYNVSADKLME